MLSHLGVRAVSDIGGTTGVATVILALLSAGTVASITLVGVAQLAPDFSGRLGTGDPSSVRAPTKVVVTLQATTSESVSPHQSARSRSSSPSAVTAVPAVLTSPAAPVATDSRRVTLPRVPVDRPTETTPAVTTPAVAIAVVANQSVVAAPAPTLSPRTAVKAKRSPGNPDRGSARKHRSRAVDAKTPSRQPTVAVLGEKHSSSPADRGACGKHPDGKHPDGKHPDGKHPDGKHPDGKHPDGKHPDGKHPDGKHPDGKLPDGKHPDGPHPAGENPASSPHPAGDNPGGERAAGGENPAGEHADGQRADGQHAGGEHADGQHGDGEHHDGNGDRGHDSGDPRHDHDGH
jgi:hypothetical protein